MSWMPSGLGTPLLPWAACSYSWPFSEEILPSLQCGAFWEHFLVSHHLSHWDKWFWPPSSFLSTSLLKLEGSDRTWKAVGVDQKHEIKRWDGIRSVTAFQVQKDGKNGCDESDRALHNRRWQKVVNEGGYTDFSQWRSPSRCEASKGFPLSLQSWIADLPAADDPGKEKANRLHSAGQKVPQLWVSSSWITTPPACSVLASFVAVFPKDLLRGRCLVWQSCHLAWVLCFCDINFCLEMCHLVSGTDPV